MLNSNKLMALAFCLSTLIYVNATKASDQILATIKVETITESYQFVIDTNQDDQTITAFYVDNFSNGHFLSREELSLDNFIGQGIKLPQKGLVTFAEIVGDNFDKDQGGTIVIKTLYNILQIKEKIMNYIYPKIKQGGDFLKAVASLHR